MVEKIAKLMEVSRWMSLDTIMHKISIIDAIVNGIGIAMPDWSCDDELELLFVILLITIREQIPLFGCISGGHWFRQNCP